MPRIVMHSDRFPDWFGMHPVATVEDGLARIDLMGFWYEWPFASLGGCMACAWAHVYQYNTYSTYNPCPGGQGPGGGPHEHCAYYHAFMDWLEGGIPFSNENMLHPGSASDQRRELERRGNALTINELPAAITAMEDALEDDSGWPGCLACLTYAQETGAEDPCHIGWPDRVNSRCYYAPWYYESYGPTQLDERARARRGDYPPSYRSRYGRGECIRREHASGCPRYCPCRHRFDPATELDRRLEVYQDWRDEDNYQILAFFRGQHDPELSEIADRAFRELEHITSYRRRLADARSLALARLIEREGVST